MPIDRLERTRRAYQTEPQIAEMARLIEDFNRDIERLVGVPIVTGESEWISREHDYIAEVESDTAANASRQ